jgi:hypothetical protein
MLELRFEMGVLWHREFNAKTCHHILTTATQAAVDVVASPRPCWWISFERSRPCQ